MKILSDGTRVVWTPLKGSQTLAMSCPASVILFHGTRGPGKTDAQLMRFRMRVGLGYNRFWRGVIFDQEYKNLDDLVAKSTRWFPEFGDGARFNSSKSEYRWSWPTGEELLFRTVRRAQDYWAYHGQEYPFIGWNELTKHPDEELYELMGSCNRSSYRPEDYPLWIDRKIFVEEKRIVPLEMGDKRGMQYLLDEIPLETFITTNPWGIGHNWVKKKFIDAGPRGKIVRTTVNVFNPRTQQREDIVRTQTHIFGSYRENIYLSPQYIATLESISEENKREAWLNGNWDIVSGGMFDDVWDKKVHIIEPFDIPKSWKIDRSFDYGSSAPFSVGWWAESDGSDYTDAEGRIRSSVRGDLFRINEWYGTSGKTNEGLRMLDTDITYGIIDRQVGFGIHHRVIPGPADNSIWDVQNGNSIANGMQKNVRINGVNYSGVTWIRSDKSPGSRKAGWRRIRDYLQAALPQHAMNAEGVKHPVPRSKPGLFVFNHCRYFIELFPVLPRDEKDPDDVDTAAEDHIGDEVRYRVLSSNMGAKGGRTIGLG